MPKISIKSSDRVFIAGKTGSGKTYLARFMTRNIKRLVVLDGKGSLSDWNLIDWDNPEARKKLRSGEPVRIRARSPMNKNFKDLQAFWDEVLYLAYKSQNCTVYIDELYAVCPPDQKQSPILFGIYTRGRELGIGVWASTQRPVWIPLVGISEAEHFFMFRLQLLEDKKRLAPFMGENILESFRDPHGFYYCFSENNESVYYPQLQTGGEPIIESVKVKKMEPATRTRVLSILGG